MDVQRLLHFSDVHFGQERGGTLPLHEAIRNDLVRDCERMRGLIGPANGVIVCGDTAFSGKRTEYTLAGAWFDRITQAAGTERQRNVFVIPGNHDVDRSSHNPPLRSFQRTLRTGTSAAAYAEIEELANSTPEDQNPLLIPLAAYREFASQYECDFESAKRPLWVKTIPVGSNSLRLIGMNSVLVSSELDAKEHMILGNSQYLIENPSGTANIVLLHHPLEWLKDRDHVEPHFYNRAAVLIVGHEHKARLRLLRDEHENELLLIDSGATNPPEAGGEYKFAYNWLEFRIANTPDGAKLSVKVYPRVWVSGRAAFAADSSRLSLDSSEGKEFLLNCPSLKSAPSASAFNNSPPVSGRQSSPAEEADAMAEKDEESFSKLQFYFWRYLDWRQRITVLATLQLLPASLDRPIPQTMEKLALEGARSQKQLKELWAAIMSHVPESDRAANPF